MLRTALRPRWLALLVLVLLAASVMAALGTWQLNRARANSGAQQRQAAQASAVPRPLDQVIQPRQTYPREAVGVRVTASGRWDGARRLLVADREQDGRPGFWVLVPLVRPDGSAVPVVRGWVATPADAAASSAGDQAVTVTGLLQPSEPPPERAPGAGTGLPAGQLRYLDMPDLLAAWPATPLITGFVVQQSQSPATGPAPAAVPPPTPPSGYDLLNLSYAIQWWVFAATGLFFWYRLVRDDHRGLLPARTEHPDTVVT